MFTKEEVKAAKATRDAIIEENISELKAIYMAGEIVMWDECEQKNLNKAHVSGSFSLADIQMLKNALIVIKNWSDEEEEDFDDPGAFAAHILREWKRMHEASENEPLTVRGLKKLPLLQCSILAQNFKGQFLLTPCYKK